LPAKPVPLLKSDEKKFIAKPGAYSFAMNFFLPHSSNTTKDTHKLGNADGSRNTGKDSIVTSLSDHFKFPFNP